MRSLPRPLRLAACLLLLALWAAPVSAQYFGRNKVQYEDFDFRTFDTENFEFFYYPEERQAVTDAARMAERWYHRHSQTFLRQFTERKPLIFYANDADFQQTNVIGGLIGQGTGGVTESLKERVTMPLTGSYAETDHVLGHELVHSFQYDIGLRNQDEGFRLGQLPLWLVEGMAEYLSVGRQDAHTAMWLRDYLLRDDLPTTEQLTREPQTYFPYRFGQAYMAYVGGKYGDPAVTNLFKLAGRVGVDSAFVYALGITADSLSQEWKQVVRSTYLPLLQGRTPVEEVGRVVLGQPAEDDQFNISPAVSPDGRYVAYIGRQNIFTMNLLVADTRTGEIVQELEGTASNPHFDALRFINSAGSWSPDGERFAFITFVQGDNEIEVLNVETGEVERRISVQGVGAMSNPAWSPDGETIAFTGLDGGLSDLYLLDLETNEVRQLTNDRYADLQPTWSPDGETIAFATDRGPNGTNFETLEYAETGLGLIDVETGAIEVLRPFGQAHHHNPVFSPDGRSLFFISDQNGFKDVYRYDFQEGQSYRVTDVTTGVSGITASSPAMSVAAQSGLMMFSVFSRGGYTIHSLGPEETQGEPVDGLEGIPTASLLPPIRAVNEGLVGNYLDAPLAGLPPEQSYDTSDYSATLTLDYVAPPSIGVGVSTGGYLGTRAGLAGGVGFFFSDMLGNHNLSVVAQANGTFKDIGGGVSYLNRENRINYGAAAAHIPILQGYARQVGPNVIDLIRQRIFITQASGVAAYPLSTTRRFEVDAGIVRYGFDREVDRYACNFGGCQIVGRDDLDSPDPIYFFQGGAAYVVDFSFFGFTSPVQGGRYRFGISPYVGTFTYWQALADYRRYFFLDPVTFAVRALHIGNYGTQNTEEDLFNFTEEYIGAAYYPGFVRGYSFNTFSSEECAGGCVGTIERLRGSRVAMASAELRLPLFGTEQFGLISFPYLPTELTLFADAGVAWTADQPPVFAFETDPEALREAAPTLNEQGQTIGVTTTRYPVFSVGTSARINLLGALVFEIYYAYPFQRPGRGGHFGLLLTPGW